MYSLHQQYGKIAKVGGLIGHPDLLFVFDGDEIRNIFKKEEILPHRYVLLSYKTCTFVNLLVQTFRFLFSLLCVHFGGK